MSMYVLCHFVTGPDVDTCTHMQKHIYIYSTNLLQFLYVLLEVVSYNISNKCAIIV